jgi:hypothetical protein
VLQVTAHGYTTGNYVRLSGSRFPTDTYEITVLTADTFSIALPSGIVPTTSGSGLGTVKKVKELTTPYQVADLATLRISQSGLDAYLTCVGRIPRKLTYDLATNFFTITPVSFVPSLNSPGGLTLTPSAAGTARIVFAVSAVDFEGVESLPSTPLLIANSVNYAAVAGSLKVSWNRRNGAASYRIYRSIIAENADMTVGQELGFIGETKGLSFIDNNIIPDFLQKPQNYFDPFSNGSVLEIDVTAGGTGYTAATTISIAGGTGFAGYPIIIGGVIQGIVITKGGEDYTTASAVTITGAGVGATAAVLQVSPASGNNPAASVGFQQRRVYAGTTALPLGLWASQLFNEDNFNSSTQPTESDAYVLYISQPKIVPIKHLIPMQEALLIFHAGGVDRLVAQQGRSVSALNKVVEAQTEVGVSDMVPARVANTIFFTTKNGTSVRSLEYTNYTNSFQEQAVSILSSHLFGKGKEPLRMEWVEEPDRCFWVVREDGRLLSLTYQKEQEIYGWTQHQTLGHYKDLIAVRDLEETHLYLAVSRVIEGRTTTMVECLTSANNETADQSWCVDAGLLYEGTRPAATLTISEGTTTATLRSSADAFTGTLGYGIRASGGHYIVTAVIDPRRVTVEIVRKAYEFYPETTNPLAALSGEWTLAAPITAVSGLWHLEGETVSALCDADPVLGLVVTGGRVTFPAECTHAVVGLPYVCNVQTLPYSNIQTGSDGRDKRIIGTAVRLDQSRGLEVGTSPTNLYELRNPQPEFWDAPVELYNDNIPLILSAKFNLDVGLHLRQRYPLPTTILGLVTEVEEADD